MINTLESLILTDLKSVKGNSHTCIVMTKRRRSWTLMVETKEIFSFSMNSIFFNVFHFLGGGGICVLTNVLKEIIWKRNQLKLKSTIISTWFSRNVDLGLKTYPMVVSGYSQVKSSLQFDGKRGKIIILLLNILMLRKTVSREASHKWYHSGRKKAKFTTTKGNHKDAKAYLTVIAVGRSELFWSI